jgi:UTP--glucose-1-phosphate uridylyltransferase
MRYACVERDNTFGQLLRSARETANFSRAELGRRAGLEQSYLYRLETGERLPSKEMVLSLSAALKVDPATTNRWLNAAGLAGIALMNVVRRSVRTRGAAAAKEPHERALARTQWLDRIGLGEGTISQLMGLLEHSTGEERDRVSRELSRTMSRVIDELQCPIQMAIVPAAGAQHRVLAPHYMQRLLVRVIDEAAAAGISEITLVLAPGVVEGLYEPLSEALKVSIVPEIKLQWCVQEQPLGLGDAVLQARGLAGNRPCAVLLPDDIVHKRHKRSSASDLKKMIHVFGKMGRCSVIAVSEVPRLKMPRYGMVLTERRMENGAGFCGSLKNRTRLTGFCGSR